MFGLSITAADGSLETHHINSSKFSIGRGAGNDLVIENPIVSRQHAIVHSTPLGYSVQDLGSKNGTWLNGARLGDTPQQLAHGDIILLGNVKVTLRFYTTDETVTAIEGEAGIHGISVDLSGREVWVQGQRLTPSLSRKEFDVLASLWKRRGQACPRDVLAAEGWPERPEGDVSDSEIDQYIRRLRVRLGDSGKENSIIQTIRGYGYKIP